MLAVQRGEATGGNFFASRIAWIGHWRHRLAARPSPEPARTIGGAKRTPFPGVSARIGSRSSRMRTATPAPLRPPRAWGPTDTAGILTVFARACGVLPSSRQSSGSSATPCRPERQCRSCARLARRARSQWQEAICAQLLIRYASPPRLGLAPCLANRLRGSSSQDGAVAAGPSALEGGGMQARS